MSTPRCVELDHHKVKFLDSFLQSFVCQKVQVSFLLIVLLCFLSSNYFSSFSWLWSLNFLVHKANNGFFCSRFSIFDWCFVVFGEIVNSWVASDAILCANFLVNGAIDFCQFGWRSAFLETVSSFNVDGSEFLAMTTPELEIWYHGAKNLTSKKGNYSRAWLKSSFVSLRRLPY